MTQYLNYSFNDTEEFIQTFDELPLWSAPFGLLLLKHLELKPNLTVLDVGSGAGFPLLELASRMGNTCQLYGIEPWKNANLRTRQKIKNYELSNVELLECSADNIPLQYQSADLIVSNLGINNFEKPQQVFHECYRVLKPGGKLALTTNLYGHWKEFYTVFYETLEQMQRQDLTAIIKKDEEHRGNIHSISQLFTQSGFTVSRHVEETFKMKFVNGSAFLNHHFVKLGWLSTWLNIIPKEDLVSVFTALENNLNAYAEKNYGLNLTVPMAFVEGQK